jgi:hypothetical protein
MNFIEETFEDSEESYNTILYYRKTKTDILIENENIVNIHDNNIYDTTLNIINNTINAIVNSNLENINDNELDTDLDDISDNDDNIN